jgi:peptide/nickel transport system permease protein
MQRYLLQRLASLLLTLFGVSVAIFFMIRLLPGNLLDLEFLGDPNVTPEIRHRAAAQLGLVGSYPTQYFHWIGDMLQGNLGRSLLSQQPVSIAVGQAIPITAELIVLGVLFALLLAIPLGMISAVMRDRPIDYLSRFTGLIGISIPNFWLATLFLIVTSRVFHWVPSLTYVRLTHHPLANLEQFFMPAIAMSVFTLALVMRMLRTTMLEVMKLDYVRTARAKGLSRRRVLARHVLRNALIPVATVVGYEIGYLISSAVVVENIFDLPGLGSTLLNALNLRDYPTIEAIVMIIAAVFLAVNTLVDVLYGFLDPRISLAT